MAPIFSRRRTVSPWMIFLPAAGFLIGLAAVFLYFSPRVVSVAPAAGAHTGSYAAITARFSAPMDPACAASHFSVEPSFAGDVSVQGNLLTFVPKNPWPAGATVKVTLRAGACGRSRLLLISGLSWSFVPSPYRVAYISADDPSRLMVVPTDGGAPAELFTAGGMIQDFQISPRGDFLVYSTGSDDTAGKIWLARLDGGAPSLLADCAPDECRAPAISPDGSMVAYERAVFTVSAGGANLATNPFIVLIDLGKKQSRTVTPAGSIESNPVWAPSGWLSYFDSSRQAIVVDDLLGGSTLVPNATGGDWVWLPDGTGVIFPEITPDTSPASAANTNLESLRIFSRLILVTVRTNVRRTLGDETQIEDTSPAVSPDGAKIAFARGYFDSRWTPGRQLWVMNLGDSSVRPLTRDPDYGVSSIRWSSDGARLLFIRFHETAPSDPPEIWTVNADGTGARALATGGYLPQWLP
jgi:Tol biopolymer transport system component